MKCHSECKKVICDIQVGDSVLVKEPKRLKLSTPYHPSPLTVAGKNHSMLTAEGPDSKVTRNTSHFKKLLTDEAITTFNDALEEASKDMWTWKLVLLLLHLSRIRSLQTQGPSTLLDVLRQTSTETVVRWSTRSSKPPKRLTEQI